MTDLEKIQMRLEAVAEAIEVTLASANLDRKLNQEHRPNGHYTKALSELTSVQQQLKTLKNRLEKTVL